MFNLIILRFLATVAPLDFLAGREQGGFIKRTLRFDGFSHLTHCHALLCPPSFYLSASLFLSLAWLFACLPDRPRASLRLSKSRREKFTPNRPACSALPVALQNPTLPAPAQGHTRWTLWAATMTAHSPTSRPASRSWPSAATTTRTRWPVPPVYARSFYLPARRQNRPTCDLAITGWR